MEEVAESNGPMEEPTECEKLEVEPNPFATDEPSCSPDEQNASNGGGHNATTNNNNIAPGTENNEEFGFDYNRQQPPQQGHGAAGRGGFRGRPWGAGGAPPRYRGRGGFGGPPGSPMGPPMRGRGGPGQFYRGRGGPPSNRFGGPSGYDQQWGPPPPFQSHGNAPTQYNTNNTSHMELWVETKTEEGKSYFYHAITRETTWTRPEGPHIKIMTQTEVEIMNKSQQAQQQTQQMTQQSTQQQQQQPTTNPDEAQPEGEKSENGEPNSGEAAANLTVEKQSGEQPNAISQQPPNQQQPPQQQQQQTPQQQQQQPVQHHTQMPPPHFGGPPPQFTALPHYAMPPPGYGGYVPPWGMGGWPPAQPAQPMVEQPAKQLIIKPGVIDPQVIARAAEWSEHRAPDGRPYYYHSIRGESVWEKPQAIRDLEAARMAAHSGAAPQPQQPPQPPTQAQMNPMMMAQNAAAQNNGMFDPMGFSMKPNASTSPLAENDDEAKNEKKRKLEAESKKKKDDEEKAKHAAAVAKQQDKSRPISSTPIAGTPWCVVWTGDGRVFFYNPSTRTSVWERPEDLLGRADVDKAIATPPEQLANVIAKKESVISSSGSEPHSEKMEVDNQDTEPDKDDEPKKMSESEQSSAGEESSDETPNKKMKKDDDVTIVSVGVSKPTPTKEKSNADIGKEAAMEAEVRAARERALVPLDVRVKSFKEMLKEKDVSAFSTWEKELHKIVFDPRYLLLTSRERKQVFEKYVKERAEEERREKRNKMRQKRDEFRNLMEFAGLHGKSSFSEFAQKYGKDDKFKSIEKMRERESLFNEYIVEVRRKEKEDKIHKKEQTRKDFIALLREHSEIDRHSRWADIRKRIDSDSRYKVVENSAVREDYFHEYCKILKDEKKKAREKEKDRKEKKKEDKKEKDKSKDKERDKEKHRDSGSKDKDASVSVEKEIEKKKQDDDYKVEDGEHQDPQTESEDETERVQRERDRQMRAELSIKEREKEVQQQLATHLRDRDKEREHHKRDEAMRHLNALLADLVRNADLNWKEAKKQLRKDHRWELVEHLDRDDRERIFNNHIEQLNKKKRDKFREMLEEIGHLELTSGWKETKKLIRDDPRYLKFNSSEKCEREFREYIKDKAIEAKASFRELLQECKMITYKTFETVGENPNHLKEIEDILKMDKRYLVLDHAQHDRTQMIVTYVEDLHKRGPPPPPTASESTRRK